MKKFSGNSQEMDNISVMVPVLHKMLRLRVFTAESCQITWGRDPVRLYCIAKSIFKSLVELWGAGSISHIYAQHKYDVWMWGNRNPNFLSYFSIIFHLLTSLSEADSYIFARKLLGRLFIFRLCTLLYSPPSVSRLSTENVGASTSHNILVLPSERALTKTEP
jgi:hypothetical protein